MHLPHPLGPTGLQRCAKHPRACRTLSATSCSCSLRRRYRRTVWARILSPSCQVAWAQRTRRPLHGRRPVFTQVGMFAACTPDMGPACSWAYTTARSTRVCSEVAADFAGRGAFCLHRRCTRLHRQCRQLQLVMVHRVSVGLEFRQLQVQPGPSSPPEDIMAACLSGTPAVYAKFSIPLTSACCIIITR